MKKFKLGAAAVLAFTVCFFAGYKASASPATTNDVTNRSVMTLSQADADQVDANSGYVELADAGVPDPAATPAVDSTGAAVDQAAAKVNSLSALIASKESMIAFVIGLLVALAKIIPNSKAGPVVSAVQNVVDHAPSLITAIAGLLGAVLGAVAHGLKSDGLFGKQ